MKSESQSPSVLRLKLPVPESKKKALLECLDRAEKRLQLDEETAKQLEKQKAFRANLAEEIEVLDKQFKTDRKDSTVLEQLTKKKIHMAALGDSFDSDETNGNGGGEQGESYHDLMVDLYNELKPLFTIFYEDTIAEIAARIRPFCQGPNRARDIARETWFALHFCNWRQAIIHPLHCKRSVTSLVRVARNMINGEDFFPFDSKMTEGK